MNDDETGRGIFNVEALDTALQLRFDSDAGKNLTIREWLQALLPLLWAEGGRFDGKRPWGNSGWQWDVYVPLVEAGMIPGSVNEWDELEDVDSDAGHAFVKEMIQRMNQTA